ncbi:MAG: DedA family protein [Alphaproteobacteria bacterium]|nr:DedA family protein [Alphaproteobacteria bacterium]
MLRRLYQATMELAAHPRAMTVLGIVSFIESSFFPIPPDVMMLPMMFAQRWRALRIAFVATATSVLGGMLGYAIGYFLYEHIGRPIVAFYGLEKGFEAFQQGFRDWGFWIVVIKGLTPIPYKIVTIASGAVQLDLAVFVVASILSRGMRFYLLALLIMLWGEPVRAFVEERLMLVTTVSALLLVGGFVVLRYLL